MIDATPGQKSSGQPTLRRVSVYLGERSYEIEVGRGLLQTAGVEIAKTCAGGNHADGRIGLIVTDANVEAHYADALRESLASAGFVPALVCLPGGETQKNLATVDLIYQQLHKMAADRRTVVVALGGGVVGDIAGFAAASYQRGLDFVQAPTTLLAQVDSSVGGKVGVNYGSAKNLIGAFHQPKLVTIDPDTLATLPLEERRSGLAEVVKYGAIADAALFELLQEEIGNLLALQSGALGEIIARSCEIKASIVQQDEREITGARATLNFGHTLGHALEAATGYARYRHGEAIAVGMVTACLIGEAMGITDPEVTRRIISLLAKGGFETAPDESIPDGALIDLMAHDKKSIGGAARFVLLESLGRATSGHAVPIAVVRAALERQRSYKSG